jgi:hypothetical protein
VYTHTGWSLQENLPWRYLELNQTNLNPQLNRQLSRPSLQPHPLIRLSLRATRTTQQ